MKLYVFDLDGTLADDTHRHHYLAGEPRDWEAYFQQAGWDRPTAMVAVAQGLFKTRDCRVEIWTGRSGKYRENTVSWLARHGVPYSKLRMRTEGDYRPDTEVKGEWLASCSEGERPVLVFDDRTKTVAWWREQGIMCAQVAQHDY